MIGIGINEDVLIKSAVINDKKNLEIELIENKPEAVKKSVFDTLLTARTAEEGSSSMKLRILSLLLPTKEGKTPEEKIQMVANDITALIKKLSQIAEQYVTSDKLDMDSMEVQFANTGIVDGPSFESRILDQGVLNRIYDNIVKRFIDIVSPHLNNPENAVRFKLIRQSKDKHYATIPSRFITDNPFIELMSVPKDQSRVKFTPYEIKEGLNDGTPVSSDTAEKKEAKPEIEANPFAGH